MKKVILVLALSLCLIIPVSSQTVNGEILYDTCNMTVVKLWGTSYERGYAYGYLTGDKMIEILEGFTIPWYGGYWPEAKAIIAEGIAFQIDSAYWNEAQAIIDGISAAGYNTSGYTALDVITANCNYDFISWSLGTKNRGPHCSTFVNWNDATTGTDLDGRSVIARHGDDYPDSILTSNFVIVIHIPSEENLQPWLHMGYVGEMASTANLNSSGYFISANILDDQTWNPDTAAGYTPIVFNMRKAMESIDYNQDTVTDLLDIKDIISSSQNGYSDGWTFTFMGPSTAVYDSMIAMMAEVAPEEPLFTFRTNSYPDAIPGDNLYAANCQIARNNSLNFCYRYTSMVNHIGWGTNIGSQENWDLMKNYSNLGNYNLYFLQFIPEWDQLKICVHQNETGAYMHDPVTFDLNELFRLDIPLANFSADTTQILVGETVHFTDLSQNDPISWKWEFEGGSPAIDTIQDPVVQYNSSGVYGVTLIVSNKYGSDTLSIEDFISVGFEAVEESEQLDFKIYPNPFNGSTILTYTLLQPGKVQFTVYNVQSQIVYTISERREKGEQKLEWSADGLPAGIYYFRIQAGEMVGGGKMVKME